MSDTGILLESGTNELELLEFTVGDQHYGINVAKIRELSPYQKPTPVPNAHPYVEGVYMPRDMIISVINLAKALGMEDSALESRKQMYIITNFNNLHTAFHVQGIIGIHRISWEDINEPDSTLNSVGNSVATGIVKLDGKIIIVLDFEKIVADINPETSLKVSDVNYSLAANRKDYPILIAEDSNLLRKLIEECLHKAGYTHLYPTSNGKEAWDKLNQIFENGEVGRDMSLVITDIEMPQMDGHHLLKLVKNNPKMEGLPVVIFSSLINEEMRRKGESLGADAQLTKPEIGKLVDTIDKILV